MLLQGVSLFHFRNYDNKTFHFTSPLTVILGNNGQGKTNLLEAIAFFSTGQSFRGGTIDDCIQLDSEYAQLQVDIENKHEKTTAELLLNHGNIQGRRTNKLVLSINQVRKQRRALIGLLPIVSFLPEDLRIITGSPARRRQFLDELLLQIDAEYLHHLDRYGQTLKRRNKVLEQIRDQQLSPTSLTFWTQAILKHGQAIQTARISLVEQLNQTPFPISFTMVYAPSVMSEERLAKYAQAEIATAHTLIGPQKDDFEVRLQLSDHLTLNPSPDPPSLETAEGQGRRGTSVQNSTSPSVIHNPQSLSSHGSRGQQRLGVFWLKLGAFVILQKQYDAPPLLLLDDIFSELDKQHRHMVLELISQTQTILTSAEEGIIQDYPELEKASIMRL